MAKKIEDFVDIQAEAGIIASIVQRPELLLFSEHLKPGHFSNRSNGELYRVMKGLFDSGVEKLDAFNILTGIKRNKKAKNCEN